MAQEQPASDDKSVPFDFEKFKTLVVQQIYSLNEAVDNIAKIQKIVDMKINAVELRLNALIEESRHNYEQLPLKSAELVNLIQQKVINAAKTKANPPKEKPKE